MLVYSFISIATQLQTPVCLNLHSYQGDLSILNQPSTIDVNSSITDFVYPTLYEIIEHIPKFIQLE